MRQLIMSVVAVAALAMGYARAADYPSRTITLVTPYAVGGGSDLVTRVLAEGLAKSLDGSVIVQNTVGAGSIIGSEQVANANPNGYTLLLNHTGMATAPALYKHLKFDPVQSFEPVGLFAETPMVIVGSKSFAPNTMKELVAYVREHRDGVTFASSGMGSATHLCAMLFQQAVGANVTVVQYKGSGPALLDLQAGRVNLLCDVTASISSHIKAGDVKAYVIATDKRLSTLPDVPSAPEVGTPNLNVSVWYGLFAPAKTPQPIVERLSAGLQAAMKDPVLIKQLTGMDTTVFDTSLGTPAALRAKLSAQIALWTPIVTQALADAKKNDATQ